MISNKYEFKKKQNELSLLDALEQQENIKLDELLKGKKVSLN